VTTAALAAPEFGTRRMLRVGDGPTDIAAADFNEDGILDLALAEQGPGGSGLSILIGIGGGRFAPAVPISTGRNLAIKAADLNGDGHVDLALTGLGPSQLRVMIGDGAGHFAPGFSGGSTSNSGYLALEDFNGDGARDVVISDLLGGTLAVYIGNGSGSFSPPTSIPVGSSPMGVVAGDFDLDGRPDIVVTSISGGVQFLRGDGAGAFAAPVPSPGGTNAWGLAAGDLTGDGIPDVVLASPAAGMLLVLAGQGNGTFVALPDLPVAKDVASVAVGDLDGNGLPDLVAGGSSDSLYVLLGTAPGSWGAFASYRSGGAPRGIVVRDMSGDGIPDVAAANLQTDDVAFLLGDGLGRLRSETEIPLAWPQSSDLAAADFNEDGHVDLAVLNSYGPFITECSGPPGTIDCGSRMDLVVATGDGLGGFSALAPTHARCAPTAVAAADFNLDGHVDVIVANRGARDAFGICNPASLTFFPGDGAGGFASPKDLMVPDQPSDIAAGDFLEDGRPEVVVAFDDAHLIRRYVVSTTGDLLAASGIQLSSSPARLEVADLDGDHHLDVAVAEPLINTVAFLYGNGGGLLTPQAQCATLGTAPIGLAIADYDGDGRVDVAAGNYGPNGTVSSTIAILHQDVNHQFCLPGSVDLVTTSDRPSDLVVADFDTNGSLDLVETDGGLKFTTFASFGSGAPETPEPFGAYDTGRVMSADFNGDGLPDIAMCSATRGGTVSVVLNTTPRASHLMLQVESGRIRWVGVTGASSYDLVQGSLSILNASHGNYADATEACLDDNVAVTSIPWPVAPPLGTGWWVLARPITASGPGTYDAGEPGQVGSRDAGIVASGLACP
jgi:hypothetical protein